MKKKKSPKKLRILKIKQKLKANRKLKKKIIKSMIKKRAKKISKSKKIKKMKKAKKAGKKVQKKSVSKKPVKSRGFFSFFFGKKQKAKAQKKEHPEVKEIKEMLKKKAQKKSKQIKKAKNAAKNVKKAKINVEKQKKVEALKKRIEERKKKVEARKMMLEIRKKKVEEIKNRMVAKRKIILERRNAKIMARKAKEAKSKESREEKDEGEVIAKPAVRNVAAKETFLKTEVPGFDALIQQGIPEGSAVLVEGGPGSGKTIYCLGLARNLCKRGKKVLYMSFEEPEWRLREHLSHFWPSVNDFEKRKLLYIKRFNALDIARSVEALLSEAKKELLIDVQPVLIPHDFDPDVVIIDSLTSIGSAFSGEESRFRIYMEQLFRYLESHQITSFLIRETSNPTHLGTSFVEKAEAVSFLSDGIIALYNVIMDSGRRKRAIEIVKMRGVEIDRRIVECDIVRNQGLVVYPKKTLIGKYKLT